MLTDNEVFKIFLRFLKNKNAYNEYVLKVKNNYSLLENFSAKINELKRKREDILLSSFLWNDNKWRLYHNEFKLLIKKIQNERYNEYKFNG